MCECLVWSTLCIYCYVCMYIYSILLCGCNKINAIKTMCYDFRSYITLCSEEKPLSDIYSIDKINGILVNMGNILNGSP